MIDHAALESSGQGSARARRHPLVALVLTSAALLGWSNLIVPVLPPGEALRATANLAAVVGLVAAARNGGVGWSELGLHPAMARRGLLWGGVALLGVIAGYGVLLTVAPAMLADPHAEHRGTGELVLRALLLIPVGTVLTEELAFRGVLHALAVRTFAVRTATGVTAAVFALWHVAGALSHQSQATAGWLPGAAVAGVMVATGVGGVVFSWLRERTGSVLAPMGLHLGTNSVGLLAVAIAVR